MSQALIDNATLTGVQRIMGTTTSRSSDSVEVDLVAFENYIQARLFYEDTLVIDDYIDKHRDNRHHSFPQLKFLDPNRSDIQKLAAEASFRSSQIRPKVQGGEFENVDFRDLLRLLQTHMICTWDISSSVYHLNLKVLAERGSENFEKYGAIANAIFQEISEARLSGKYINSQVELVDRYGNPITPGYFVPGARWGSGQSGPPSKAISTFSAALTWLADRSIYYTLVAASLKADSFLYPIRQAYQQRFLAQSFNYDTNVPIRLVSEYSSALSKDVSEVHSGGAEVFSHIDLPVFSAWLIQQCGDPVAALHALEEVRHKKEFVEARMHLREISNLCELGDIATRNRKLREFGQQTDKISRAMREKYGVRTSQGIPLTRLISVFNSFSAITGIPPLPEIDIKLTIPQVLKDMRKRTGFCAIYRNVMHDLTTFAKLGKLRDDLTRRIKLDPESVSYSAKAEDPKFRNSHSSFKSPM